jgi:LPS-assembly lipoprotein
MTIRLLFAVALLGLMSACGFQLRGETHLPPGLQKVSLEVADEFSLVARDLRAALIRGGATLTAPGAEGAGAIRVPVNVVVREAQVVSGRARVQEYVVRHRVELEIVDAAGNTVLPRVDIELGRDFTFDETQGLAAAQEEELIRKELAREMVQQILRRIESLAAR